MQDFEHGLLQPGLFLELKRKLKTLALVDKLVEKKIKSEQLKDINQKFETEVKEKMEILKNTQEKVARGESLDDGQAAEVEQAKMELKKVLESANLEVVGMGKKVISQPDQAAKMGKINKVIQREIDRVVEASGLRAKIDELKGYIKSGSIDKVKEMKEQISKTIVAMMDNTALKDRVENLTSSDTEPVEAVGAEGNLGADNGTG